MGVINSPLVEGGVFSEEVNKKEVTVKGVNSNKKSTPTVIEVPSCVFCIYIFLYFLILIFFVFLILYFRVTVILHTLFAIISLLLYIVSYTVLCDLKITFLYFRRAV